MSENGDVMEAYSQVLEKARLDDRDALLAPHIQENAALRTRVAALEKALRTLRSCFQGCVGTAMASIEVMTYDDYYPATLRGYVNRATFDALRMVDGVLSSTAAYAALGETTGEGDE